MPFARTTATVSLGLSILIILVAALLVLWQWYERRHRESELSSADVSHFLRQDIRRGMVAVVLVLLAFGIGIGARIEPKAGVRNNPHFIEVWLGVFLLLFVLLCLAGLDGFATHLYARRHRHAIAKERIEIIRAEIRRRSYRGNGRDEPRDPIGNSPT